MTAITTPLTRTAFFVVVGFILVLPCVMGSTAGIAAVAAALVCLLALAEPGGWEIARRQIALWLMAAAFALMLVAFTLTAEAPGDLLYIFNFLSLLAPAGVYVLARRQAGPRFALMLSLLALAGTVLAVAMAGADLYLRDLSRAEGFASNPNMYARMALLLGFVSLVGVFATTTRWRYLLLIGPVLGLVATIASGSRGTFVAVPAMALVFALVLIWHRRQRWMWIVLGMLAAVAALALMIFGGLGQAFGLARVGDLPKLMSEMFTFGAVTDRATAQRLEFYTLGWQAFLDAPLIGHGWDDMVRQAYAAMGPQRAERMAARFASLHNDLINVAVSAGLVGVVSLCMVLAAPVTGALTSARDRLFAARLYIGLLLGAGYAFYGVTDTVFGNDLPTNAFPLIAALVLGGCRMASPDQK